MADIINNVKTTFSSWDSCMSKTYCKWPVIAAIIIGSLIVLSVLWCVFSCLCCGISLCAACGRCVTCFGCCGACDRGGSRRRKDPEYHPMPPTPTPYQGYQPQSNMMYSGNGPQFATFDSGNKRNVNVHEDSLPTMPSWDAAPTRRVEDRTPIAQSQPRGADMEMERMLPHHAPASPIRDSPYQSDLGAQRLGQHQQQHEYYDPPTQPLSPAPTYYSSAPPMAGALHDRQQYQQQEYHDTSYNNTSYDNQHTSYNGGQVTGYTPSATPYPSSRESTQFAQSRAMSPPQHEYTSYQTQAPAPAYEQPQVLDNRPPSMLTPGRRPVAGSYREV